jgi:hypothetical protein
MRTASANGLRRRRGQIWTPAPLVYPHSDSKAGLLKTDFLLVSRLPKDTNGGAVTILSGGHGAGTRSLELLLDPAFRLGELEALCDVLDGAEYFQFVLEAGDIEHRPGHPSVARTLKVSEECPPEKIAWANPGDLFKGA